MHEIASEFIDSLVDYPSKASNINDDSDTSRGWRAGIAAQHASDSGVAMLIVD
jgi:hypothetical protein